MLLWQRLMAQAAASAPAGQAEFTFAGTYNWTVPAGVTSICAVLIQGGASDASTLVHASVLYCRAQNGARIGDGGGDGGDPGLYNSTYGVFGGGGGAGGYAGKGGFGGSYAFGPGGNGAAGSGAGGGGGSGVSGAEYGSGGGGVGLKGAGATGVGGSYTSGGKAGSGGSDGAAAGPGGAFGGGSQQQAGGALSYKNNIPVTPGTTVTIVVTGNGGARIIWGAGRAYPSTNTGDV